MSYTIELNSARKDADFVNGQLHAKSPVVEVFSAMVEGREVGKNADKVVNHIKSLAEKAQMGDVASISEINTIRKYVVEPKLMEEIKLLGLFGSYQNLGYGESIEREVYSHEGEMSRYQALGGDVTFPFISTNKYPVAPITISAGMAVDYRKMQLGDMSKENEAIEQIKIDIRNKASRYVMSTAYNAVKNAGGIKYFSESAGITKTVLDDMINKIRRFGQPTVTGDYAMVSQVSDFVPYESTSGVKGISDAAMEEIRKNAFIRTYKGCPVVEIPNGYDLTTRNADGTNFGTIMPDGVMLVIPTGAKSPIATWTRGGLTSFTGNDVTTGKVLTRYDLEIACDVAKGQEFAMGVIGDTTLTLPTV